MEFCEPEVNQKLYRCCTVVLDDELLGKRSTSTGLITSAGRL